MPSLFELIRQTYRMAKPSEGRVVMNNVASLSILQVITYLLPILIIPYLFRMLGPDKFGLIAFAQAFVQYFVILTNYGFNASATKEISLHRHDRAKVSQIFSAVMIVKIILMLVSLVLLAALVHLVPKFTADWPVYAFSFGSVIGSTLFPHWFFQGTEKMNYIKDINITVGIISAIATLFLVRGPEDYLMVPIINSVSALVVGLWGQRIVARVFKVSPQWQTYRQLRHELETGWDVFISAAAINAYTTTRVFLLGLLTNNNITGFYSIAERIANACQTFPLDSFSQAIFPRLSKIFHKNKAKAFQIMLQIQRITVLISLICLSTIMVFADVIVKIACGAEYPETVLSLRLLLIAVFFVAANAFRVQFLIVCCRTRVYSAIHVCASLLGLPLIFVLIRAYSYRGAALATIIIETSVFIVTYLVVRNLRFASKRS